MFVVVAAIVEMPTPVITSRIWTFEYPADVNFSISASVTFPLFSIRALVSAESAAYFRSCGNFPSRMALISLSATPSSMAKVSRNGPRALDGDRVGEQQDLLLALVEAPAVEAAEAANKPVEKNRAIGHRRHHVRYETKPAFQRLQRGPGFFRRRFDRLKRKPLHFPDTFISALNLAAAVHRWRALVQLHRM